MEKSKKLHLAIIPDGNRRWAKSKMMMPWKGHEKAVKNFKSILSWCEQNKKISILTIWCFSTENWKRDKKEKDILFNILLEYLHEERSTFIEKKIRLMHSGRKDRIPKNLINLIDNISNETKDNNKFILHLALDYGGKDEICRAVKKATSKVINLEEIQNIFTKDDCLKPYLDQPSLPDIDLIIRTSGEIRTSNFFLWQSTYAEWIFTEILFPDFTKVNLKKCIKEYFTRKKRFGS